MKTEKNVNITETRIGKCLDKTEKFNDIYKAPSDIETCLWSKRTLSLLVNS